MNMIYYPEEILIQKLQDGEFNHVDYILHHYREWAGDYRQFCQNHHFIMDESSALRYLEYKDHELEMALENGDA